MASCKLNAHINRSSCTYSASGVKALYLGNWDLTNTKTLDASDVVSAITLTTGEKIYEFEFVENTASVTDELVVNSSNKYRTHTVNATLESSSEAALFQSDTLSLGKFFAIVVDKTDTAYLVGFDSGMVASAMNYNSGAAASDDSGWTLTLAGSQNHSIYKIKDLDVFKDLIAAKPQVGK